MKIPSRFQQGFIQLSVLLLIAIAVWQVLHRSPNISADVYPYLSSLSPALVKQCAEEHRTFPTTSREDLLAIRSTLPNAEAQPLIDQLNLHVAFSDLNWAQLPANTFRKVRRHREILEEYTFFQPNKYTFPVLGTTWYEDSFGADREGGKRKHEGTDLFGKEGTPIVSIGGGIVEQLGWNRLGGERVGIRGDDGNYYYYAHLQFISPLLVKGKRIKAGEAVGSMGHTGDAFTTPDHLHFGIELPTGEWVNPYTFIAIWQYWGEVSSS